MKSEEFIERENERAKRLIEFVKGELRNMFVDSRMQFTTELFTYLIPEIRVLLKEGKINPQ